MNLVLDNFKMSSRTPRAEIKGFKADTVPKNPINYIIKQKEKKEKLKRRNLFMSQRIMY